MDKFNRIDKMWKQCVENQDHENRRIKTEKWAKFDSMLVAS